MNDIAIIYNFARACRLEADKTGNPYLYEYAAQQFDVLLMTSAAQRCRDRAARLMLLPVPEPIPAELVGLYQPTFGDYKGA